MLGPCSTNKYAMKQSAFQEDVAQNIDLLHFTFKMQDPPKQINNDFPVF